MKIAIIGATRGIGLALVESALADGHEVTALVRDPSRMPVSDVRLRLVTGSAEDAASIAELTEGQDVVCDTLGTRNLTREVTLFSHSAKNLAAALRSDQLLIAVTGIGTGDSKGHATFLYDRVFLPFVLRRMYADKERQEAIIKERIARWMIVRPAYLTNGPRTGNYEALTDLRGVKAGPSSRISRADVADFILAQAKTPDFIGQTPLLVGASAKR